MGVGLTNSSLHKLGMQALAESLPLLCRELSPTRMLGFSDRLARSYLHELEVALDSDTLTTPSAAI